MKHLLILLLITLSLQSFGQSVISMGAISGNSINTVSGGVSAQKGFQFPMKLTTWTNSKWNLANTFFDSGWSFKLVYNNGTRSDTIASQHYVDSTVVAHTATFDTTHIYAALADSMQICRDSFSAIRADLADAGINDTARFLDSFASHWVAIEGKVNYTDTAAMLSNYLTAVLARVKYSDTSAMLANYLTAIAARVKYSDTSAMLSNYLSSILLRVKYSDTAAMLVNYLSGLAARVKYTDTSSMLASYLRTVNATPTPTALTVSEWDPHKGFSAQYFNASTVYLVSSNSSITLTVDSAQVHVITGSTAGQTFRLPVTSTLALYQQYIFDNTHNTQSISIKGAAGLSSYTVQTGSYAILTCTGITGASGTGEWSLNQGITNNSTPGGDLTGTFPNSLTLIPAGTAGTYGSATTIPQFTTDANGRVTSVSTLTATPAFGSVTGNISTSQMNGGTGASSSTYFRGDGTWSSTAIMVAVLGSPSAYITGTVTETNIIDLTIPAGLMGANTCLIFDIEFGGTGTANSKTATVRAGSNANSITDNLISTSTASSTLESIRFLRFSVCNQNSLSSQLWTANFNAAAGASDRIPTAINTANQWYIHFNGTIPGSGDKLRVSFYEFQKIKD